MFRVKRLSTAFSPILFCAVFFVSAAQGQNASGGGAPADQDVAVRQLLAEVRELRLFLQKSSTAAQMAQVALERVRMQQQRVDSLMREQEAVRQKLKSLENNLPRSAETVTLWETKVALAENPNQRADWEQAVRDLKRENETIKRDLLEYREKDAQLTARINAENQKLDELNGRLDTIEREMETVATDNAQSKPKKP